MSVGRNLTSDPGYWVRCARKLNICLLIGTGLQNNRTWRRTFVKKMRFFVEELLFVISDDTSLENLFLDITHGRHYSVTISPSKLISRKKLEKKHEPTFLPSMKCKCWLLLWNPASRWTVERKKFFLHRKNFNFEIMCKHLDQANEKVLIVMKKGSKRWENVHCEPHYWLWMTMAINWILSSIIWMPINNHLLWRVSKWDLCWIHFLSFRKCL